MSDFFPSAGLHLKKVSPHEMSGSCPRCGGRDRFRVFLTDTGDVRRYWCRQCGTSGDAIDLRMTLHGDTYAEACAGKEERQLPPLPGGSSLPNETWRRRAAEFLAECQAKLMTPDAIVAIANERSIPVERAIQCGLGWHCKDEYQPAAKWGITGQRVIRVPRGIVIATRRPGVGVVALTVRRCEPNLPQHERFWQIRGGARDLAFTVGESGRTTFLVESQLDAALIFSESDGRYSAVASCGASKTLDEYAMTFLRQAPILIVAPDNDSAGREAWQTWRAMFPEAVCYCPPAGYVGLGKAHQAVFERSPCPQNAMTGRDWLPLALAYARQKRGLSPLPGQGGAAA